MNQTLVSIVLCSYNGERFIVEQVESILQQDYAPLEIIIADDCSTDNTWTLLQSYADHPSVRLFRNETTVGMSANFMLAAAKANGRWIAFSDQDDRWLPHKITTLVNAIGDHPLIYSDSLLVNENGESLKKRLSDIRYMYSGEDSRCYILYSCVWGHAMMVTNQLLQNCQDIPVSVHHDMWIAFKAFQHGGIFYHDEVLTHYRQHANSATTTLPRKKLQTGAQNRYNNFKKKLYWIEQLEQHASISEQPFYRELRDLFAQRATKKYVPQLFRFLLQHRAVLFKLTNKKRWSQYVEIAKYARGERDRTGATNE